VPIGSGRDCVASRRRRPRACPAPRHAARELPSRIDRPARHRPLSEEMLRPFYGLVAWTGRARKACLVDPAPVPKKAGTMTDTPPLEDRALGAAEWSGARRKQACRHQLSDGEEEHVMKSARSWTTYSRVLLTCSCLALAGCASSHAPPEWRSSEPLESVPEHAPHGTLVLRKNSPCLFVLVNDRAVFAPDKHDYQADASKPATALYRLPPGKHTIKAMYFHRSDWGYEIRITSSEWLETTVTIDPKNDTTISVLQVNRIPPLSAGSSTADLLQLGSPVFSDHICIFEGTTAAGQVSRILFIEECIKGGYFVKTSVSQRLPTVWVTSQFLDLDRATQWRGLGMTYLYWIEELNYLKQETDCRLLVMLTGDDPASDRCIGEYTPSSGVWWRNDGSLLDSLRRLFRRE